MVNPLRLEPRHLCQVLPLSDAGVVCSSLSQTWLSQDSSHSVINPSPPLPPPSSLKSPGYGLINHLCKEQWCVCKGRTVLDWGRAGGRERERGVGCQVQVAGISLPRLGSSSPNALDWLTCICTPTREVLQGHTLQAWVSLPHAHTHIDGPTQKQQSCFEHLGWETLELRKCMAAQ